MSSSDTDQQNGVKTNLVVKQRQGGFETTKSKELVRGGSPLEISVPLFDGKTMWVRVDNSIAVDDASRVADGFDGESEIRVAGGADEENETRAAGGAYEGNEIRVAGGADDDEGGEADPNACDDEPKRDCSDIQPNPLKMCYCTAQPYPKLDFVAIARKAMEEEFLPITKTLSELQEKVRSMNVNEKNNCICGVAVPTLIYPNKPCVCAKPVRHSHKGKEKDLSCDCSKKKCGRSKKHDDPNIVNVGCMPILNRRQSDKGKGHRRSSTHTNVSSSYESKPKPGAPSVKRDLGASARSAFYSGVISHYMGSSARPPHTMPVCGCSSIDSLDSMMTTLNNRKKQQCALQKHLFPMRPGQPMMSDPDDTSAGLIDDEFSINLQADPSPNNENIKVRVKLKKKKSGSYKACGKSSRGSSDSSCSKSSKCKDSSASSSESRHHRKDKKRGCGHRKKRRKC